MTDKQVIERTEKIFGKGWRPEYDTMDTFVCSSFYYIMYLAGHQQEALLQHPGKTEERAPPGQSAWPPAQPADPSH